MIIYHAKGDNVSFVPRAFKDHPLLWPVIPEDDHECLGLWASEKLSDLPRPATIRHMYVLTGDPGCCAALALPETGGANVCLFGWLRSS